MKTYKCMGSVYKNGPKLLDKLKSNNGVWFNGPITLNIDKRQLIIGSKSSITLINIDEQIISIVPNIKDVNSNYSDHVVYMNLMNSKVYQIHFFKQPILSEFIENMNKLLFIKNRKKILFIINPFSGYKDGIKKFNKIVMPILQLCPKQFISYNIIETKKSGHAFNAVRTDPDLLKYSSIVTISGDGLMHEVINGIMGRRDKYKILKNVSLGIIPTGTGNSMCNTLGLNDISKATLAVIKGKQMPIDLMAIKCGKFIVHSFITISWGLLSDINLESDNMRWLGQSRYTVYALHRILNLRTHQADLCYLLEKKFTKMPDKLIYKYDTENDKNKNRNNTNLSFAKFFDSTEHLWKFCRTEFITIFASKVHTFSDSFVGAPHAKLNDGSIDLIIIKSKNVSKTKIAKLFMTGSDGSFITDPQIEYCKVKGFILNPQDGYLSVDGEKIYMDKIFVMVKSKIANFIIPPVQECT